MAIVPRTPAARWRRRGLVLATLAMAASASACSEPSSPGGPAAERGRQVYLGQCIACHNPDPSLAGPLGPPVKGSSRELLEAKILKGKYPPGYTPKRSTTLMPAQPVLEPEIATLHAYLQ
jgi:mono/diheme cytochrome c family protein